MLILSDCIKVEICANSPDGLECWLQKFGDALQGITALRGKGYWNGSCEDVIEVTHYLNPDQNLTDFINDTLIPLLTAYKIEANQEAVFFTINGTAYLVDDIEDFQLFGEEGVLPPSLTSTPGTVLNWGAETHGAETIGEEELLHVQVLT